MDLFDDLLPDTEPEVEEIVRSMREQGLARRSSAKMLTTLRAVFDYALRKGILRFNPATDVTAMGKPSRERDALTASELEKLRGHGPRLLLERVPRTPPVPTLMSDSHWSSLPQPSANH